MTIEKKVIIKVLTTNLFAYNATYNWEESESNTTDDQPCCPLPQVLNEEKSVKDIHALKSPKLLLYLQKDCYKKYQNYCYMKSSK